MQTEDILKKYFYPHDSSIFVLHNLPEVIKGTLFSRYSRTNKDIKQLFLDEFFANESVAEMLTGEAPQQFDVKKAEDFYERVLVGYGDDSVAELGGAHIAVENISMLVTKAIEEHRLGLSPLEKSTRYVYYDRKVDGEYLYFKDPVLMDSKYKDLYISTCELLFDTYSKIVRDAQPTLKKIFPGDENDKAYTGSIRAKACDIARSLLPLATKTNMGVFGNGRAFEYLLTSMMGDELQEVRDAGKGMYDALSFVIGPFIKRAMNERGEVYRQYVQKTVQPLKKLRENYEIRHNGYSHPSVELVYIDTLPEQEIVAALLYQYTEMPYAIAMDEAQAMSREERQTLLMQLGEHRELRQHKPHRAVEEAYAGFEIVADWGVYKDLMRHRVLTRHKKLFSSTYGYYMPSEIEMLGFKAQFKEAMDRAAEAYHTIAREYPYEAQYLVTHGSYTPFYVKINMRALSHMCELRATSQGHPSYRFVAQEMARLVSDKYPILGKTIFKFVDYKNYDLERLEAFKKIEKKAKAKGVEVFTESD